MKTLAAVIATVFLASATTAAAHTYDITVTGVIDSAVPAGLGFSQGAVVTLHTTFDDQSVFQNPGGGSTEFAWVKLGGIGPSAIGGSPVTAPFTITAGSLTWPLTSYLGAFNFPIHQDTFAGQTRTLFAGQGLNFTGGSVTSLLGSGAFFINNGTIAFNYDPTSTFSIQPIPGSAVYAGHWNFGSAAILVDGQAVPEPATWATLITGFGLIGLALRRRRGLVA
jgi:hypothetical protein